MPDVEQVVVYCVVQSHALFSSGEDWDFNQGSHVLEYQVLQVRGMSTTL